MKIRIEPDTLSNEHFFPLFDVLLLLVEAGRHTFDDDYLDDIFQSEWYLNLKHSSKEIIKISSRTGSFLSVSRNPQVVVDQDARVGGTVDEDARITRVQPFDALQFLMQPFSVIVENEWFDGGFLLWMAKALNIQTFSSAYRQNRFQFRNAGGKGSLHRSAQVISEGVWPRADGSSSRALRLWNGILMDSDSEYPGHDPNQAIREACQQHSAWVKQLEYRSIENYIPKASMLKLFPQGQERSRAHAYFNMTDEQRKHYHMKQGFRTSRGVIPTKAEYLASPLVHAQCKTLFASVSDKDWDLLASGFGGTLSRIYVNKTERPDPGLTKLQSRSLEDEMKQVIG